MRRYYRISRNVNNTVSHLTASFFLSLYVMWFVNVFIGSVGGIPAFLGFFGVYYCLRSIILPGNRLGHQLTLESRDEIRCFFINYGLGYLLLWMLAKFVILLTRIFGWANANQLTLNEYIRNLYGSTILEKWSYFFAAVLMLSFILSLFPLIVIRKRGKWMTYLILDSGFFAGICSVIAGICRIFIKDSLEKRAACVLDDMLLCSPPKFYQAILYLLLAVSFSAGVIWFVYRYSVKQYGPKKGNRNVEEYLRKKSQLLSDGSFCQKKMLIFTGVCAAAALIGISIVLFFAPSEDDPDYEKVAEFLTEDSELGPMVYKNELYVPTSQGLDDDGTGTALGYLADKGQNCDSRFYKLAVSNVLYQLKNDRHPLKMEGSASACFEPLSIAEKSGLWKLDEVFLLWDEDWLDECTYSKDITGYTQCRKEFAEALKAEFGAVEYHLQDFADYDAFFVMRSYRDFQEVAEAEIPYGTWVGCILVKDNEFYYGNYDNRITGKLREQLLEVLGGY